MPELKERIPSQETSDQRTQKGDTFLVSAGELTPQWEFATNRPAPIQPTGAGHVECRARDGNIECREKYSGDQYAGARWDKFVSEAKANCSALLKHDVEDQEWFCNPEFKDWFWAQCHFDAAEDDLMKQFQFELVTKRDPLTRQQPGTLQNFTKDGFEVGNIPEDLFEDLRRFWLMRRLKDSHPENSPKLHPVNPGCLSNTWVLDLPEKEMRRVADRLRPMVATWSGTSAEDLQVTAVYGVRLYRHGAILEWHADRRDTHALSVILQLGVLGFGDEPATPWPLEVYSHDGRKHTVPQRPGELVLYESATCLHARPGRFQGRETANLFVHYAPRGWPDIYDARLLETHDL